MIIYRLFFDKDKEAKWLNEMSDKGWEMKSFFAGVFTFDECEKGKYKYQIDLCDKGLAVSKDYREFMEDAGIEIVQTWGFWVILRKLAKDGDFQLYSDIDSQIEHYKKVLLIFKCISALYMLIMIYEIYAAATLNSPAAWGAAFCVMAFAVLMINVVVRTKNCIYELNERKSGIKEEKKRSISPFLVIGLFFNSICLIFGESMSSAFITKRALQILAIVFMLYGVICTFRARNQE